MKLDMLGWNRTKYYHKLFEQKIAEAGNEDGYKYCGLNKSHTDDFVWYKKDGNLKGIHYKFRIEMSSTMGGAYQAQLTIDADDVLSMFMDVFGDIPVHELMKLLAQHRSGVARSVDENEP